MRAAAAVGSRARGADMGAGGASAGRLRGVGRVRRRAAAAGGARCWRMASVLCSCGRSVVARRHRSAVARAAPWRPVVVRSRPALACSRPPHLRSQPLTSPPPALRARSSASRASLLRFSGRCARGGLPAPAPRRASSACVLASSRRRRPSFLPPLVAPPSGQPPATAHPPASPLGIGC